MSPPGTPRGARTRAALTLAIAATALTPAVASAAAGDLDPSFGTGGKRVLAGSEQALDVFVQADGKIVEVGGQNTNIAGFLVRRLNADGSPDRSFDGNGSAIVKFPNVSGNVNPRGSALQPDGSVVVAGNTDSGGVALARFRPDGSPDPAFAEGSADGVGRTVLTNLPFGFRLDDLVLQPGGKIALAGTQGNDSDFGVVRLRSDGSVDATTYDPADFADANDNAVAATGAPDGTAAVLGTTDGPSNNLIGGVARYKSDGKLDPSFGATGLVKVPSIEQPTAAVVQPDGKLLIAGSIGPDQYKAVITRLTPTGEVDKTFGTEGTTEIRDEDLSDAPTSIALQSDGKIIVSGATSPTAETTTYDLWVARLGADGHLDPGYGAGGRVSYSIGEVALGGPAALQPDGKVVSAGFTAIGLVTRTVLTRLQADGQPESSGGGGATQQPGGGQPNPPRDTTAPRLTGLRVVGTRRGRELRFAVSEPARVRFALQRAPRQGRPKAVSGGFSVAAVPGKNRVDITRRQIVRRLTAGRYRLVATPTDASGNEGVPRSALFRVAKKKK